MVSDANLYPYTSGRSWPGVRIRTTGVIIIIIIIIIIPHTSSGLNDRINTHIMVMMISNDVCVDEIVYPRALSRGAKVALVDSWMEEARREARRGASNRLITGEIYHK